MVIGIVGRDESINGVDGQFITKNNLKYLDNRVSYVGILTYDNEGNIPYEVLELCDGVIIQGGRDIYPYHYEIVNYCLNNGIPLLGICMGEQIIGLFNGSQNEDDLIEVDNHYGKDMMHRIKTVKGTWLNEILGEEVMVNSRHMYALGKVIEPIMVSAYSDDNVIEAIELINDDVFVIGVQWHPEDLDNMDSLYNAFIKEVWKRKKDRDA